MIDRESIREIINKDLKVSSRRFLLDSTQVSVSLIGLAGVVVNVANHQAMTEVISNFSEAPYLPFVIGTFTLALASYAGLNDGLDRLRTTGWTLFTQREEAIRSGFRVRPSVIRRSLLAV